MARTAWRLLSGGMVVIAGATAYGQPTFSIDYQGPPKGAFDTCPPPAPIRHCDLLLPPGGGPPAPGPLATPCVVVSGGMPGLGLLTFPPPVPPGIPGTVEVDALSYGVDPLLRPSDASTTTWYFSVNEFAIGIPGVPPDVASEGAAGPFDEAAADVFATIGIGPGGMCVGPVIGNTQVLDGNGLGAFGIAGLGLVEPLPPAPGIPPGGEPGSNLDALDMDTPPGTFPIYFSLDAAFFDPAEFIPNTGSAAANGFVSGATVLVRTAPGGPTAIYAPAFLLGLDLVDVDGDGLPDEDSDDLDALVLHENGVAGFQPPTGPYSWLDPEEPTDMFIFSVRDGSAVIGAPDSLCGIPITPNDLLIPPLAPGLPPARFIPGAMLGLAPMDELDALDVVVDCDLNGISDIRDVLVGGAADCNGNLIPDSCEPDCNGNTIPDDCDLDPSDPDGDGVFSLDCNGNYTPDECEVLPLCANPGNTCRDCQPNGIPDDCDIESAAGEDCNDNGVPDACDIASGRSNDCTSNGVPDECEPDCNLNGVNDSCDINGWTNGGTPVPPVSEDCNTNGIPDECDVAAGPLGFAAPASYAAAAASDSIALADLDGDRDLDLVWPNFDADTITIRWNDATGNYPTSSDIAVGDGPVSLAVGDMNNDTDLDVVVVNRNARTISVLQNNGLGTSWFRSTLSVGGSGPQNLVLADFDYDGDPDIAVTDPTDNSFRILLVSGFATGVASNTAYAVGTTPIGIAVGDYFGHGHLAIIVANFGSDTLTVMHPDIPLGGGTYHLWATFPVADAPYAVTLADLDWRSDNDSPGDADIIVAHAPTGATSADSVSILPTPVFDENTGEWVLPTAPVSYMVGTSPAAVSVFDFDRDGDSDMVAACRGSGGGSGAGTYVLANTSTIYGMSFSGATVFDDGSPARHVAVGDLNGDTYPDLAAQGATAARILLSTFGPTAGDRNGNGWPDECESDCNGNGIVDAVDLDPPAAFEPGPRGLTNAGGDTLWLADLDGDGDLDAITTSSLFSTPLMILRSNGDGAFPTSVVPAGLPPQGVSGVAIGDIDRDGLADLALADGWNSRILVVRNTMTNGVLTFAAPQIVASTGGAGVLPGYLVGGDFDGDGDFDLAFTDGSNDRIAVMLNTTAGGAISFSAPTYYTAGDYPWRLFVADMEDDDDLDLLVLDYGSWDLRVFTNNGSGSFASTYTYVSASRPTGLAVADLNADGLPDVAMTHQDSNSVTVRLNNGTGVLGASQFYPAGTAPASPVIEDFNGDGTPDIAVTNYVNSLSSSLAILRNNGNSTFAAPVALDTQGYFGNALVAADLDRDGRMDLAARSSGSIYGLMNRTIHLGNPPQTVSAAPGTVIPSGPGQVTTPPLNVSVAGVIEDVDVTVNITHPYPGSLALVLIHPDGTSVTLAENRSGFGPGFINTTFDDDAGYSFTAAQAPLTGRFRPAPGALSVLHGKAGIGDWRLRVIDSTPGDTGAIVSWSLTFRRRFTGCGNGDVNGDGVPNGADIQAFMDCLLSGSIAGPCAAADLDGDGDVDMDDLSLFLDTLLSA